MMFYKSHININGTQHIGSREIANRLIQAPMAGISVRAFRLQARRFGAGLVTTEMISSYGVHYRNRKTLAMLDLAGPEHPVSVQIFGSRPDIMADAARVAEQAGADMIDINMGCPVRKVVKTGAGVALMEDEALAADVAAKIVNAVNVPVTAKIRSGPRHEVTAARMAKRLEQTGVAAVCIHPRLGSQGRKGRADHSVTAALVSMLEVPVIASGDIDSPAIASRLLAEYGCAAVMVGRAALGNPWLFADLLEGAEPYPRKLPEVLSELELFSRDVVAEMGEERAGRFMRKFYGWYLKPFDLGTEEKAALRMAASFTEVKSILGGADSA